LYTTSLTLLQHLRVQNPLGWEKFTKLYLPLLYKWLRSVGIVEEDAQDLTQDIFVNIYSSLSGFQHYGKGSFRRWVRTIVNRRISDYFRRKNNELPVVPIKGSGPRILGEAWELVFVEEVYQQALSMLRKEFSERDWQAFERQFFGDEEPVHIAASLKISVNNVAIIRCRVLQRLRELVGDLTK